MYIQPDYEAIIPCDKTLFDYLSSGLNLYGDASRPWNQAS